MDSREIIQGFEETPVSGFKMTIPLLDVKPTAGGADGIRGQPARINQGYTTTEPEQEGNKAAAAVWTVQ